jgi:hypothetical protein
MGILVSEANYEVDCESVTVSALLHLRRFYVCELFCVCGITGANVTGKTMAVLERVIVGHGR